MAWDELTGSLDFVTLRALYASGELRPEDVVRAVYRRIAARGQDHVWIHLVPEADAVAAAQRVAAALPASAPLYGLPCAIKDNIDVPGLPSTNAFPPSRRIATRTGPAVQRLLDAGAIVIGKTNMDQLAIGLVGVRTPYGVARNAFDAAFVPGGSSSGSGVAVGAGLVSFALGNDAAGSGRVPAAFNNIVGVKPTPGLVSNTAVVGGGTAKSLESISVFALIVDDGMHVLRLIAGYDPEDLFSKTEARFCNLVPRRRRRASALPCRAPATSSSSAMRTRRGCSRLPLRGSKASAAPLSRCPMPSSTRPSGCSTRPHSWPSATSRPRR